VLAVVVVAAAFAGQVCAKEFGVAQEGDLVLVRERFDGARAAGEVRVEMNRSVARRIVDSGRGKIRDFPLPGRVPVDLDVSSFNLLTPDARFVVVDEAGPRDVPPPAIRTFRGKVEGDEESLVLLSFFENRVAGFIRTWDAEYAVEPEHFNAAATREPTLLVRERIQTPGSPPPFVCEALDAQAAQTLAPPEGPGAPQAMTTIDGDTLLRATIAVDATRDFYEHFGSVTATQSYIINLMAQVSTIYESEVNVQVEVSFLRVFTAEPDPYTYGSLDTSVLLDELRSEWTANQTAVPRTAAHLFSVRPSGGSGLAYVDVLCNTDVGYGVSTISANGGSWEKDLVAHEIGHNFSSPHTHCYVPEIDQCANQSGCYQGAIVPTVGTIMSYCGQSQSVFHPRVKDERIRPAAEAAFPACIDTAGLPGSILTAASGGLLVSKPAECPTAALRDDDGGANSVLGYNGTTQMAWIKRFSPACHPFRLTNAEVMIAHGSIVPGRPIRLLVYTDPAGSGDPANAALVHSEDVTVQVVSAATFNGYTLSDPVVITSGDYYVGFYDLLPDTPDTFIATLDTSGNGDSFNTGNSTSPGDFNLYSGATWMIRASGGAVDSASISLQWDPACNEADTPGQDYGVYGGSLGDFLTTAPLTCSTDRATSYLTSGGAGDRYFVVVPQTSAAEGSYGLDGSGAPRLPSAQACNPQDAASCP